MTTTLRWMALAAALAHVACGGGAATSKPAEPGIFDDKPAAKAIPEGEGPEAKAARRFLKLGKEIEELGDDDPINSEWLEDELKEVLDLDPKHAGARFNLAVLKSRNGAKHEALCKEYESILDDNPDFIPAAENLAYCHVEAGEVDEASEIYREQIKKDPKALTSRMAMARILMRAEQYKPAIELCRKVLQRKADAIEAFRILAQSYRAMKDTSMAELIIGRGLKIEPDDVELHYLTARLLLDRGDLAGGIDKFKHVLSLKPKWLKVRAELARILLNFDDWGNAAPHFEAIIKEAPNDRGAQLNLAVCYKGMGRYEEADKLFSKLLAKNPNDADALWNQAMLQWHNFRNYDKAIDLLIKFASNAPSGDKDAGRVDKLRKQIEREKRDVAARKAREERERKRIAAIEAACQAVKVGNPPKAEDIGSDEDRIKAAWDLLLVTAVTQLQQGALAEAKNAADCSLAIVPTSAGPGKVACAQLRVNWVQLQDQAGLLMTSESFRQARKTIGEALECDPENPDAQVFFEQLGQLIEQMEAEEAGGAGDGGAEPGPEMPGGTP